MVGGEVFMREVWISNPPSGCDDEPLFGFRHVLKHFSQFVLHFLGVFIVLSLFTGGLTALTTHFTTGCSHWY